MVSGILRGLLAVAMALGGVTAAAGAVPEKRVYGDPAMAEQPPENKPGGVELITEPLLDAPAETRPVRTPKPTPTLAIPPEAIRSYSAPRPQPMSGAVWETDPADPETDLATEPLVNDAKASPAGGGWDGAALTARVDPSRVHLDESVTVTWEWTSPDVKELGELQPPRTPGLELINRSRADGVSVRGREVWRERSWNLVYLAKAPGTVQIPPAEIDYRGRRYRSSVVTVDVEGARSGYAYHKRFTGTKPPASTLAPAAPEPKAAAVQGPEISAELSRAEGYVLEPVVLSVRVRYQGDDKTQLTYQAPELDGFLIEELSPISREEVVSGVNRRYVDRTFRTLLFPLKAGSLTVGSAGMVLTGQSRRPSPRQTEPLTYLTKALPPDPKRGRGASLPVVVGVANLTARVETASVQAGQPVRMLLRLEGRGHLRGLSEPALALRAGVRAYFDHQASDLLPGTDGLVGTREYAYWLVCLRPGDIAPGIARYRAFDPANGSWSTIRAELPELRVKPTAEPPPATAGTRRALRWLRPNHPGPLRFEPARPPLILQAWFWGWQTAGPLALVGWWGFWRWRRRADQDLAALRRRRAYSVAQRALRRLRRHIRAGRLSAFYDGLAKTTTDYLSAKFGLPPAYVTAERLSGLFSRHNLPESLTRHFRIALTACEYVRYAAVVLPARDMRALYRDLRAAVRDLERWTHRARRSRLAGVILLAGAAAALGSSAAQAGQAEQAFLTGNALAAEQRDAEAEQAFRRVLAENVDHPDVFYNLGNAYARQGKLGPAILAYARALRRAPRDADIRANLTAARALVAKEQDSSPPGRMRLPAASVAAFAPDELALAGTWLVVLGLVVWAVRIAAPDRWRPGRWLVVWLLAGAAAVWLWGAVRATESAWRPQAVVLATEAPVRVRPHVQGEVVATLPEGAQVRLRREETAWVEVELAPGRRGWVERRLLGLIE